LSTSFDDIFDQFLSMVDDTRFINGMTTDMLAVTLSKYLDEARGLFGDYCYKDLDDYTATQREYYEFAGNGSTVQYTLSPFPPTSAEFYVSVDDVETIDYLFNSSTNIMTLSATPVLNSDIYIGAYKVGQFTETLNIQEISILANAMQIPYIKFYLQKRLHLNQMIYGKDTTVHSQANQLKELRETLQDRKKEVEQKIMQYTYKQNDDDLDGISGANYLSS
jgi:hypothetical protein